MIQMTMTGHLRVKLGQLCPKSIVGQQVKLGQLCPESVIVAAQCLNSGACTRLRLPFGSLEVLRTR